MSENRKGIKSFFFKFPRVAVAGAAADREAKIKKTILGQKTLQK